MIRTCASLLLAISPACQAIPAAHPPTPVALQSALTDLYQAFNYDAGKDADWTTMRALFLPGATFIPPVSPRSAPAGDDAESFLASFQTWVRTGEYRDTGLYERILETQILHSGHIAHAWVTFEGYLPTTGEVQTRGIDSIQFVLDGDAWKLASFTTQYEPN